VFAAALNITESGPKLCVSDVMVNHPALLVALHSHPSVVSMDTVEPPPAAPTEVTAGATVNAHPVGGVRTGTRLFAACVIRTVRSATTSDALRASPPLVATAMVILPGPVPVDPDVTVTHGASPRAVHAQPAIVLTFIRAVPPDAAKL
jgi:hypothetical protein